MSRSNSEFIKELTRIGLKIRLHKVVDKMIFIDAFHFLSTLQTAAAASELTGKTSMKGTMDPEGSACNSCNSWPL